MTRELSVFIGIYFVLHLPIYAWHQSNKSNNKPPKPAIAFILSFFPGPLGGILYVFGLIGAVPCLIVLLMLLSNSPSKEADQGIVGCSVLVLSVLSACSALVIRISMRRSVISKSKEPMK